MFSEDELTDAIYKDRARTQNMKSIEDIKSLAVNVKNLKLTAFEGLGSML